MTTKVAWNSKGLTSPLANLGYRKISMNVKIAMLVAASEYERLTLDAARSSPMEMPPRFVTPCRTNNISHPAGERNCDAPCEGMGKLWRSDDAVRVRAPNPEVIAR